MMRRVDTALNGFSRSVALMTTGLALLLMLAAAAPAQAQPGPAAPEQEAGEPPDARMANTMGTMR